MDAVASGLGAHVDDRIADAGGGGIEDPRCVRHAHGHRVDQDVAVVSRVEGAFAGHRRNADAVAVAADTGDDAGHQMAHLRVLGAAETQRVEVGDRPGAHGEDVAQDAADAGRGALVGLDVGRVVVAFHLEDDGLPIADVDDAGVLAGTADHPGRLGGQLAQPLLRRLVGAVLAPHHREDAEFGDVGLAAEHVEDLSILVSRQAVLRDHVGGNVGGEGPVHVKAATRPSNIARPSVPPCCGSASRSGCGIMPRMLPRSFRMPAILRREPLGLPVPLIAPCGVQ